MLRVCAQLGAESTDDVDPVMGLVVLETREDECNFQEHVKLDTFDHRNSLTTASGQHKKIRHGSIMYIHLSCFPQSPYCVALRDWVQ